jgi:hypothetical protein
MIIDAILYLLGAFIGWVASILPTFSVYPPALLEGINFFGQKLASLDFFIFNIPQIMVVGLAFLTFEINYFLALKIVSVVNFFRGSGKLEL